MRIDLENIDDQVYSVLIEYVKDSIPRLENENFTNRGKDYSKETTFPIIYFHRISGAETNTDLEADMINSGLFTYEIIVTSKENRAEVKEIMTEVTKAMKSMAFRSTSLPLYVELDNNLHRQFARWQRDLHEGDLLDFKTSD